MNDELRIEKLIGRLLKANAFDVKDVEVARVILYLLNFGYKRASKLSYSKKYLKNLLRNGFIDKKTKKVYSSGKKGDFYIEFLIMINGAYGFIQQVQTKNLGEKTR